MTVFPPKMPNARRWRKKETGNDREAGIRMGFGDAVRVCLRKYATFSGRASRPEYWWFVLFLFLVTGAAAAVDGVIFGASADASAPLSTVIGLTTLLPSLAAAFRRLHDTGRLGWSCFTQLHEQLGATRLRPPRSPS